MKNEGVSSEVTWTIFIEFVRMNHSFHQIRKVFSISGWHTGWTCSLSVPFLRSGSTGSICRYIRSSRYAYPQFHNSITGRNETAAGDFSTPDFGRGPSMSIRSVHSFKRKTRYRYKYSHLCFMQDSLHMQDSPPLLCPDSMQRSNA